MAATLAFPGDVFPVASTSNVKLGPGLAVDASGASKTSLSQAQQELVTTAPGFLGLVQDGKGRGKAKAAARIDEGLSTTSYWVESNSARYVPSVHDHVICQITARGQEAYQVTLMNAHAPANLPALSFEGATKRNKPNLRVGTLLYAQVVSASRHAEVELTCIDAATGKSSGFGELKTERTPDTTSGSMATSTTSKQAEAVAMLWPVSCGLARSLLLPSHQLLGRLAAHFPFEVAIGVNGFVWVRGHTARHVVAIGKVLACADQQAWVGFSTTSDANAMTVAKERGLLSTAEIARIVEPFK